MGENIEILNDPDSVVATVGIVKEEPVAAPVVEEEAAAEPEVIGKGKKEEEGCRTGEGREGQEGIAVNCRFPIADLPIRPCQPQLDESLSRTVRMEFEIGNRKSAIANLDCRTRESGRRV